MTDIKHTAGPWKIVKRDNGVEIFSADHSVDGKLIATMSAFRMDDETAANAAVVAAAPQLLDVANAVEVRGPDGDGLVWLLVRADGQSAAFNLVQADERIASQVLRAFEQSRRAALPKAAPKHALSALAQELRPQLYLIEWLAKEPTSAYGECKGADFDRLFMNELVTQPSAPEGRAIEYARVSLTAKGRELAAWVRTREEA